MQQKSLVEVAVPLVAAAAAVVGDDVACLWLVFGLECVASSFLFLL